MWIIGVFDSGQARQEVVPVMMYDVALTRDTLCCGSSTNNIAFELLSKKETEIKQNFDSDLLPSCSKPESTHDFVEGWYTNK